MSPWPPSHQELQWDLEAVQARARAVLRRERRHHAWRPGLEGGLGSSGAIGAAYLCYLGLAHLFGGSWPTAPAGSLALLILLPGLAYLGFRILAAHLRRITVGEALAAVDQRHHLEDRLQAAAEFLRPGDRPRSAFMEAALVDAAGFAESARKKGLPPGPLGPRISPRAQGLGAAALAFYLLALWIPIPARPKVGESGPGKDELVKLDAKDAAKRTPKSHRPRASQPKEEPGTAKSTAAQKSSARKGREDSILGSEVKKTLGVLGSGQSADAASASGASEARGAPSSQAQASLPVKKPAKKQKTKPKKRKPPLSEPSEAKKPENDSGATAGRGAASGSNRSPSASPWSSKDQVTSDDEEDLEEDEDVDDEFDNSDARGGVQPHLRDRRPPVNRDLGIGFGNEKNPDANGRGGPSELKKSRGVASLVLGVPIPDHVKGQPNPGKTKITQERVEPKAEDAEAVDASARRPRAKPLGHLTRPRLEPWMRDLVRSYFQALRKQTPLPSPNPSPSPH